MEQLAEKYNCNVWWSYDIPEKLWCDVEFLKELLAAYGDDYYSILHQIPANLLSFELLKEYVKNDIEDICYVAGGSIDGKKFKEIYEGEVYINACSSCGSGDDMLDESVSNSNYDFTYRIEIKDDSTLYIENRIVKAKNIIKHLIDK